MTSKFATFSLRGFDLSPNTVQSIVGVVATESGAKGDPVRPGVKTLLSRSFVRYSVEFRGETRLDELIPELLKHLGGCKHLCDVRDQVSPEFIEVDIRLTVKGSDQQEGGFLPHTTLAELTQLRASLTFQFI